MLNYVQFYTRSGIRHPSQLMNPPLSSVGKLYLPVNAVYHYTHIDEDEIGVTQDDPIMRLVKSNVVVEHVSDMPETVEHGRFTRLPMQVGNLITEYHRLQPKWRRLQPSANTTTMSPQVMWVISYSLLYRHYRYVATPTTNYDRWLNNLETVLDKINQVATTTERQQYLLVDVPTLLPSVNQLNAGAKSVNQDFFRRFGTDSKKMVLALWDWIGGNRDISPLARLSDKALSQLNLILQYKGSWTVISMTTLDSWRLAPSTDDDPAKKKKPAATQVAPNILQMRFLRFLLAVIQSATVAAEAEDEASQKSSAETKARLPDAIGDTVVSEATAGGKKPSAQTSLADIIKQVSENSKKPDIDDDKDEIADETEDEINDDEINKDLEALEKLMAEEEAESEVVTSVYKPYTPPEDTLEGGVVSMSEGLAKKGLLTAAEHRRFTRLAERYKEIENPFGEGTLAEYAKINPEDLVIGEKTPLADAITGVLDESMLSSSIKDMDDKYVKKILNKDIVNTVLQLQKTGIIVTDYKVTHVEDIMDSYDLHTVSVTPVKGKPSTIRFQIPRVKEDATFKARGVINHMRKQRGDVPIRKTGPDTVALTSYYSKMFVNRSDKSVDSYTKWLTTQIIGIGIDPLDTRVNDLRMGKVFAHDMTLPRTYTAVATKVSSFVADGYRLSFDIKGQKEFFRPEVMELTLPSDAVVLIGQTVYKASDKDHENDEALFMRMDGTLVSVNLQTKATTEKGILETLIGLDLEKKPIDIAEVGIFAKSITVGFLLAHQIGLGNLLATLKPTFRRALRGDHYNLLPHEYAVKFEDEVLIFDSREAVNALIFGGLNRYHRELKRYSVYSFDKKEVYANVLESQQIGVRWVREFDQMFKLWVDPITKDLLLDMKEPTDLFNLFISACKKLILDDHPREMDMAFMRDKGYERISGMVYFEMIKALRVYNARPVAANASLDVNPMAVWMSMIQDQSVRPTDQSNPIQAMKDKEVVIYSGAGGRTGQSMVAKSRVFDKNALGVISEAGVDSGDVGTITYTTADPNYNSLRGTTRRIDKAEGNAAKLISTSFLLAPAAENDDPKRIVFVGVQNSQTTHVQHAKPMPTRTGYERVMAHRSNELYAQTARTNGVIDAKTDKHVSVKYEDGEIVSYPIGRQFGVWGGSVIPHDIACEAKPGDKVEKGDVILYNQQYFSRDVLDPKQVIFKTSVLARTVLWESTDTLEDSNAIDETLANLLVTLSTETKYITVKFDEEIRNLVKVGDNVNPESILCTIHPSQLGGSDLFSDTALSTLHALSANSPKAKMHGRVDKYEVLYTGEPEDMSASLRTLVDEADYALHKQRKAMGQRAIDGRIEPGFRAGGNEVGMDTVVIKLYITGEVPMHTGDKCVFGNQMKSIVGRVMTGKNETLDGEAINAIFSYEGIDKRVVRSAIKMGLANTLLVFAGREFVKIYESEET